MANDKEMKMGKRELWRWDYRIPPSNAFLYNCTSFSGAGFWNSPSTFKPKERKEEGRKETNSLEYYSKDTGRNDRNTIYLSIYPSIHLFISLHVSADTFLFQIFERLMNNGGDSKHRSILDCLKQIHFKSSLLSGLRVLAVSAVKLLCCYCYRYRYQRRR